MANLIKRVRSLIYDKLDLEVEGTSKEAGETIMKHLQDQTRQMTLSTEHRGGGAVQSNPSGHLFLNYLDDALERLDVHGRELAVQKELGVQKKAIDKLTMNALDNHSTISQLQTRVETLSVTSETYLDLRRRFVGWWRRDVEGGKLYYKGLKAGNERAHEGDCVADAVMWEKDNRTDTSRYQKIYGFDYRSVLKFRTCIDIRSCLLFTN